MWTIPFLPPLFSYAAAGLSSAVAGLGVAWRRSGMGRARARAKRNSAPVIKEAGRFDRDFERWRAPLGEATRNYAKSATGELLAQHGLEELRERGASGVRLGVLEKAGYRSLADLYGASEQELARAKGIGAKSARKVLKAARRTTDELLEEGLPLPAAELASEEELQLGQAALLLLDAKQEAGEDAARVRELGAEFTRERRAVRTETSFGRWLLQPFRRRKNSEATERATRLGDQAQALRESGVLERARAGRKRLRQFRPAARKPAEVRQLYRDRFAECCAILDEIFVQRGLRPPREVRGGRGGVTDEVAARVEKFPLRAGALRATLRPYQEFGAKYILAQERTILGDEMGLGKTMQTLAAMVHRKELDPGARFFVVAPAGLLINWEREIQTFTGLEPRLLYGDELEANLALWILEGGVAITSYATLRNRDLGAVLAERNEGVDLCAADEAHFIKNPEAGRTQAVRRLFDRSTLCVLLSGTPMENHPREFLELIDGIRPEDGAALRARDLDLGLGRSAVAEFHRAVSKVYLRRNQEDVLTELPERLEVEEWVDPSREDLAAYAEMVHAGNFMGMRRAATLGEVHTPSAKLERLEELLTDHRASGRKVIVFSFFLGVLAAIAERFPTVGTISGKLGPREKQDLCDEFQAGQGHGILLLQINAGGQGLNLQAASVVVLCEPQTKPSTEAQAIARAHRMGQTRRVLVHRLLARGTCDEPMMDILAEKSKLFDAYARKSLVKEASKEATETQLAKAVLEAEVARLGATD